ncbi:pentatricopeptide repeat-containing protein At4g21065-like [Selaginella moellendorffii]|uniref:pentatricopeptide repeat-containing protein At4g21065-like n=1 Tax=Selaginella moellendorffii TaxID=88036 RepID=UPI000D1C8B57|nr:pentatricopeptide repeat-containing protein At4g21065-like [Selaginella moellendorffii]|eukprot:XP_024535000.1 pentatricopeptide repeat-containing protein At4g21065-like [Selaginella moellendorffii]
MLVRRNLVKRSIHCSVSKYRHRGDQETIDLAALDTAHPDSLKDLCSSLIKRCGRSKNLADGRRIHHRLARNSQLDRFLANLLIEMYGKCGSVGDARRVFDEIGDRKNIYSWTIMIAAAASNGSKHLAMQIFREMDLQGVSPNHITYVVALEACSSLIEGRHLYDCMVADETLARDHILGNALITMYGRFQRLDEAFSIFKERLEKDVVTWNAMVAAFAQNGYFDRAMDLFKSMDLKPDAVTFLGLIAGVERLEQGLAVHTKILANKSIDLRRETNLSNSLISMYGRFCCIGEARKCFSNLKDKDVVSWNAMLLANAQSGDYMNVLELYQAMDLEPDQRTFLAALDACANLTAIQQGREVHSRISRHHNLDTDVLVGNSLIYMYAKFGCVEDARLVFDRIHNKDVISWTAIIAAHCQNGYPIESLELFVEMQQQGIKPDLITYGCVLSACSYAGLVYRSGVLFLGISSDYGLTPNADNFSTMVDVLSRAGWLEHAEELIRTMPFLPDPVTWTMLLGACKVHGDVDRAKRIAEAVCKSQSKGQASGDHVLLSNLFAAAKKWDDVKDTRKRMERSGVRKQPGRSWIEIDGKIHEFLVGDTSHNRWEEIHAKLLELGDAIAKAGYVPSTEEVLHDIEDASKSKLLGYHSEKVAIAFGVLSTPHGTPLRVMKNLRMCCDCHAAAKMISKVTGREIIVRDANRFHKFVSLGECTCRDFW